MSYSGPSGRGVVSGSHAPVKIRAAGATISQNRRTSTLFPIPASPPTNNRPPDPAPARCSRWLISTSVGPRSRIAPEGFAVVISMECLHPEGALQSLHCSRELLVGKDPVRLPHVSVLVLDTVPSPAVRDAAPRLRGNV